MSVKEDIEVLRKINREIPRQRLIEVLNDLNIEYTTWTDLDMYIYYIQHNLKNYELA